MKIYNSRTPLFIAALLTSTTIFAQSDTYSFLYADGYPVNLGRANNHGVSVGTRGFDGMFYKDGKITTFALPGDHTSSPYLSDINDAGDTVGEYFIGTAPFSFGFLRKAGALVILQVPGEGRTTPQGLNNHDVVVGTFQTANNKSQGFIYKNGVFTKIAVPNAIFVNLSDINDAGDAVGQVTTSLFPTFSSYPFLYRNGVVIPLPVYPGFDRTLVTGINNRGEISGNLGNFPPKKETQTGFILRNGAFETFRILGSLAFSISGINDKGDVTGDYFTVSDLTPSFVEGTSFIRYAK
jgi:hypothetical protein